jgi:hypothetical protein
MGIITLLRAVLGQPDSSEEPKVITNFNLLEALLNGNLDTANLHPRAGLTGAQIADLAIETRHLKAANVTYAKLATDVINSIIRQLTGVEMRLAGPISTTDTGVQQPGSGNRQIKTVTHNLRLVTPANVVLLGQVYNAAINNPAAANWAQVYDGDATNSCQVQIENVSDAASLCVWRGFVLGWGGFN